MPFFWLIFGITEGNAERFSRFREIFRRASREEEERKREKRGELPPMIEKKTRGKTSPDKRGRNSLRT